MAEEPYQLDTPISSDRLKQRMRSTWMAGDFGQIAQHLVRGAEEFVNRLGIAPGMRVLDVGCGTGNTAIPAARKGARVVGIDIATNLLGQARQRTAKEELKVLFEEADAECLPYPYGQFDLVVSMFGAMFAPHPERVASELTRVCRPGGTIAMANWTPDGFVGNLFCVTSRYVPLPKGVPSPVLWGVEEEVRRRLGRYTWKIDAKRRAIDLDYPFSPEQVVQFYREYFGPIRVAFANLDAVEGSLYAEELEGIWSKYNEAKNGRTRVLAEYLEVIATRACNSAVHD